MLTGRYTVTVLRRAARDRHGDETFTPAGELEACLWAPAVSSEDTDNREQVQQSGTLYPSRLTVAVHAKDRVKFPDGREWFVDGEPESWAPTFGGSVGGSVINLRRVKG